MQQKLQKPTHAETADIHPTRQFKTYYGITSDTTDIAKYLSYIQMSASKFNIISLTNAYMTGYSTW